MDTQKVKIVRESRQTTILVWVNDKAITPQESFEYRTHSTDFEAGYGGSGPAQLALAILLEVMSAREAQQCYQGFKWHYIADPRYQEVGTHEFTFNLIDVRRLV